MTGRSILLFVARWPRSARANFGRVLAAYGGVFIVGSLAWGMVFDGFRPDRYDISGVIVCMAGVAVIMYAPAELSDAARSARRSPQR